MLLKSLKLKDFRQFKGEQEITFSTDPVRNVTVIMGENGSGKTTLAQAFTWCLYGDTDFDDKSMLCKATGQTMLPGNEEKVRVELALQHNNIDYLCIREQLYSKDIIFIKDTDGELAETYMGDKVGSRFEFDKKNEFETNLVTR